jgi:hypothetical protein
MVKHKKNKLTYYRCLNTFKSFQRRLHANMCLFSDELGGCQKKYIGVE